MDTRIYVKIAVVKREAPRVREDTVATGGEQGLLGDKMIELSSDGKAAALGEGQTLKTEEPLDFQKYVSKFDDIADKVGKGGRPHRARHASPGRSAVQRRPEGHHAQPARDHRRHRAQRQRGAPRPDGSARGPEIRSRRWPTWRTPPPTSTT